MKKIIQFCILLFVFCICAFGAVAASAEDSPPSAPTSNTDFRGAAVWDFKCTDCSTINFGTYFDDSFGTTGEVVLNSDGVYQCEITFYLREYFEFICKRSYYRTHTLGNIPETVTATVYYDSEHGDWYYDQAETMYNTTCNICKSHSLNENGCCTVCAHQAVAKVDSEFFSTIDEAIATAEKTKNATLTLLCNVQPSNPITAGTFTLDLNGKKFAAPKNKNYAVFLESGHLTIADSAGNGSIVRDSSASESISACGGNITILGGSFDLDVRCSESNSTIYVYDGFFKMRLSVEIGNAVLYGGTYNRLTVSFAGANSDDVTPYDLLGADCFYYSGGLCKYETEAEELKNVTVKKGADFTDANVTVSENYFYTGSEITPDVIVTVQGYIVPSNDYNVTYTRNGELTADLTNSGDITATITAKADSPYTGTASVDFTIAKATPVVTPPTPREGMVYTNLYFTLYETRAQTTGGTLMYKVNDGEWGTDTVVNGKWPAGTYTVYYKVVGDENYESVDEAFITVTFLQQQLDKINPTVTLFFDNCIYDGTAKTPDVSIVTNLPYTDSDGWNHDGAEATLEAGKDFTVTYSDNVNAGTATVTIQGIGNFIGTVTRTFTIGKAIPTVTVPTNLTATYGDTLADVELPEGFAWQDGNTVATVTNSGYVVVYTPNDTENYDYTGVELTKTVPVTVSPKEVTITVDNKTICVGGTYTLTCTVDGLLEGDTLTTNPTLNTNATVATAGEHAITASGATVGDNYTITYQNGTLIVREHEYSDWEKRDEHTHQRTCDCGKVEYTYHNWDYGDHHKLPTCVENGEQEFVCKDCGASEIRVTSPEEDKHSWNEGVVTANPTCTEKGVKTFTCTHNSAHTYTEDVDALGHKYDNACDATCNTCGEERTPAEHYSENADGKCDECGERFELSDGAVAGIVSGSVAILGGGGFALWWFVFRKKRII